MLLPASVSKGFKLAIGGPLLVRPRPFLPSTLAHRHDVFLAASKLRIARCYRLDLVKLLSSCLGYLALLTDLHRVLDHIKLVGHLVAAPHLRLVYLLAYLGRRNVKFHYEALREVVELSDEEHFFFSHGVDV